MGIYSFLSKLRLKSRLSFRILFYIILCSTIFTFISTVIQLYAEYQRDIGRVNESMNQIRESYLNFLSLSLWHLDRNQLNMQLKGALFLPGIQYLEVRKIDEKKETVFYTAGIPKSERVSHYQYPLVYESSKGKKHLGNLYITVNLEGVYQRLYDRLILILTTQAIKTFLWAFCVLIIFQYIIMRNLNKIANYLKQMDMTRLNIPLTLNRQKFTYTQPDELEHVVMAINNMRKSLMHSIAERRQAEEALRQLNRELDQRVKDRTADLEAANKELETFSYSVSHDLQAPLRHIEGFMILLQKKTGTTLDEEGSHYMDTISTSAKKMGLLIDDLLSFSRMGRQTMSFNPVNLGKLVRDVIGELEPDTTGRQIEWHIDDLYEVNGDAAMLKIVLVNLISNALKFTQPRDMARIEIGSLHNQNSEAVIFIRDNGVGFDMTYADNLFTMFQRLHHTDQFEGTGIGLANVRRIIERHGGRTWAEGKVDRGATIYFSLSRTL